MKTTRFQIVALTLISLVVVSMVSLSLVLDHLATEDESSRIKGLLARSVDANDSMSQSASRMLTMKSQSSNGFSTESTYTLTRDNSQSPKSVDSESLQQAGGSQSEDPALGKVEPSFEWLDSNTSIDKILATAQLQNRDWVYGWLELQSGFNRQALSETLQKYQTSVIGTTGLYARVRLPASKELLNGLANETDIAGFGLKPGDSKIGRDLDKIVSKVDALEPLPVFVTVLANNDSSDIRQSLSAQGATVGQWLSDIRSYSINLPVHLIDDVARNDYVEEVSINGLVAMFLDSASAVVGIDRTREYQSSSGSFEGSTGQGIAVGVLDTGINADHVDFASKQICGVNFISNAEVDEHDLFIDEGAHGTHVTGIISGDGVRNSNFAGAAPGVKQLRIAKVLDASGSGTFLDVFNAVNFMFSDNPCTDGTSSIVPSVVNVSLGAASDFSDGKALFNRKLDSTVFELDQSWVIAAGNSGAGGISNIASTKNAIVVGAVHDNGVITDFSSHGPTADDRLSPHIAAPGGLVTSVQGEGSLDGYIEYSGTSMAAPMVAGMIALELESNDLTPAQIRAVLMAEAVKPSPLIGQPGGIATNNTDGPGDLQAEYGMGVVTRFDAWVAGDEYSQEMSSTDEFTQTITIPSGVARVDVVLTWLEPPATTFSDTVHANFDLYFEEQGVCELGPCGSYSSKSTIDNNEWVLLKNPPPGDYSIRVVPVNDFTSTMKVGLAWRAIGGEDSPQLSIESSSLHLAVRESDSLEIDLTVSVDEYFAAGTTVHLACDGGRACSAYGSPETVWHPLSSATHVDGTFQHLERNALSVPVSVGEVIEGQNRIVRLRVPRGVVSDSHTLHFVASSFNAQSDIVSVDIQVQEGSNLPEKSARPSNDSINDAVELEGEDGSFQVDLLLASREPGELMVRGDRSGGTVKKFFQSSQDSLSQEEYSNYSRHASVWYELTTQVDSALLAIVNHPSSSNFALYEATEDGPLLVYSRYVSDPTSSSFSAQVKGSTRYLMQVASLSFEPRAERVAWSLGKDIPPANDHFDNAEEIEGETGTVAGTNFNSTLEAFEFYGTSDSESTWFKWTATNTETYRFNASPAKVLVFSGSNKFNLLRISSIPISTANNFIRARENETYYIAVVSSPGQGNVNDYELAWSTSAGHELEDNDNFDAAATFTGKSGSVDTYVFDKRTVEPDEPVQSGLGSLWWKWTPDESGKYTFALENIDVEHLTAFSGSSLEELTYLGGGRQFAITATAGQTYHIAHGFDRRFGFHDLAEDISQRIEFSWGIAPENDLRDDAIALSGETGEVRFTHENATSSTNDPRTLLGSHSLWWKWTVPATGWYSFELEYEKNTPLDERKVDSVLGILKSGGGSNLIATSDRSYVLSGVPEATIYAVEDQEYLIEVVLRTDTSTQAFAETSFRWTSTSSPSWLRYQEKLVSASRSSAEQEVEALIDPQSIALDAASDTLYVVGLNEMVELSVNETTGSVQYTREIDYVDQNQNAVEGLNRTTLGWDGSNANLYAVHGDALYLLRNVNTDSPYFETCIEFEDPFFRDINQLLVDSNSEFFYLVGDDFGLEIAVYKRDELCDFTAVQRLTSDDRSELRRGSTATMDTSQAYFYITADQGLLTYARNADTGELSFQAIAEASDREDGYAFGWDDSSVRLSPSGNHLFVAGRNAPYLALYNIVSEPQNPELVSSISEFYADPYNYAVESLRTRENLPVRTSGCVLFAASKGSEGVHLMCDYAVFSVSFVDDELRLVDMLLDGEYDRFGTNMRDVSFRTQGFTQGLVHENNRAYIISDDLIDSLLTFELASNIDADPY